MILKACCLLVLSVAWNVSGTSFSNVFVQTGPEVNPEVKYLGHGASPYGYQYPSSQISQYSAAPISYEYPFGQSYSYTTPCSSGACIYPDQTIASIAPATPSANVVTYSLGDNPVSTLPYVYGRNEPASSYSYVLVNEGAGQDVKLSDGEVIRGGYAFVQPEGLVQYVADENQGLNAIFKSYIPNNAVAHTEVVHHEIVHHEPVHHAEPCHGAKSAALTAHKSHDESLEEHHGKHEHHESEKNEGDHDAHHTNDEARHGGHHDTEIHEYIVDDNKDHIIILHETNKEVGHETEPEKPEEKEHEDHEHHKEKPDGQELDHEGHGHHDEENAETTHESENHEKAHTHEAIVEVSHKPHENHNHEVLIPAQEGNNAYISYKDFIKCIQAAMTRGNTHPYYTPVTKPASPLTYLVFNKPC